MNLPNAQHQAGATLHLVARARAKCTASPALPPASTPPALNSSRPSAAGGPWSSRGKRMFEEWKAEQSRREATALDELAVMHSRRHDRHGGHDGEPGHVGDRRSV